MIKLAIFDVDGVLTNGELHYGETGQMFKTFHAHDGIGFAMLLEAGVKIAVITDGPLTDGLMHRLGALQVPKELCFGGSIDKRAAYKKIKKITGIADDEIVYMGDDVIDYPVMAQCCHSFVPDNTSEQLYNLLVQNSISFEKLWTAGGKGFARDACEKILTMNGVVEPYAFITKDYVQ